MKVKDIVDETISAILVKMPDNVKTTYPTLSSQEGVRIKGMAWGKLFVSFPGDSETYYQVITSNIQPEEWEVIDRNYLASHPEQT